MIEKLADLFITVITAALGLDWIFELFIAFIVTGLFVLFIRSFIVYRQERRG